MRSIGEIASQIVEQAQVRQDKSAGSNVVDFKPKHSPSCEGAMPSVARGVSRGAIRNLAFAAPGFYRDE